MTSLQNSTSQLSDEERKAKRAEQMRSWRARNPEKAKSSYRRDAKKRFRKKLGITDEEVAALLQKQNNCCAICGADNPQRANADWALDHCHSTGKVRGLLCHPCNTALGLFKDDVTALSRAISYLKAHNG